MKTLVGLELALLVAASACGSAQGATTDGGSTFAYSSKQQVQCNTVTTPADDPQVTQIQVTCTNVDDLPLVGSCSNAGPRFDAILGVNHPLSWQGDLGGPAGWICGWFTSSGESVHVPYASATICCVVKS